MLEAMAYSIPVIVSRVGSVPEVIRDNQTGLLVKPGDVESLAVNMHALASSPGLRRQFGQAGRSRRRINICR